MLGEHGHVLGRREGSVSGKCDPDREFEAGVAHGPRHEYVDSWVAFWPTGDVEAVQGVTRNDGLHGGLELVDKRACSE